MRRVVPVLLALALVAACGAPRPADSAPILVPTSNAATSAAPAVSAAVSTPPTAAAAGCRDLARATAQEVEDKSGSKPLVLRALEKQVAAYLDLRARSASKTGVAECAGDTAKLLTKTANAWYREAVGSQGTRGTGDPETMDLTIDVLQKITSTFSSEEYASLHVTPPTMQRILYTRADLLYFRQRWSECAKAFDAVVAEDPHGKDADEAHYAAELCRQNVKTP